MAGLHAAAAMECVCIFTWHSACVDDPAEGSVTREELKWVLYRSNENTVSCRSSDMVHDAIYVVVDVDRRLTLGRYGSSRSCCSQSGAVQIDCMWVVRRTACQVRSQTLPAQCTGGTCSLSSGPLKRSKSLCRSLLKAAVRLHQRRFNSLSCTMQQ